jgi:hypothetical protein
MSDRIIIMSDPFIITSHAKDITSDPIAAVSDPGITAMHAFR